MERYSPQILVSNDTYASLSFDSLVEFKCFRCEQTVSRLKANINHNLRNNRKLFCTKKCQCSSIKDGRTETKCANCKKVLYLTNSILKTNNFCTKSCAAVYNNTHKTHGTRRSKLELWLETKLTIKYFNQEIHFNRKDTINSELDIYFPDIKLAFELNGIYHYEPIHGVNLLSKIQTNDTRKFQACLERGIELCIIDTSHQKIFKEHTGIQFLEIITNIVDQKLLVG